VANALHDALAAILGDDALDAEGAASSKAEEIEKLITDATWPVVEEAMLALLADSETPAHWRVAAEVLWGAALDRRVVSVDRVIAHLCFRYPPNVEEDNLAWSITSKLKGVSYLSDYDPLQDAAVRQELERLRAK